MKPILFSVKQPKTLANNHWENISFIFVNHKTAERLINLGLQCPSLELASPLQVIYHVCDLLRPLAQTPGRRNLQILSLPNIHLYPACFSTHNLCKKLMGGYHQKHLLYDAISISSGNSVMFTSKRSCTSFRTFASFSSDTNVMARPLVPKRPARATCRQNRQLI